MDIIEELNDKQKEAVLAVDGPCLVIAGAGSRKNKSPNTQNSIYDTRKTRKTMEHTSNHLHKQSSKRNERKSSKFNRRRSKRYVDWHIPCNMCTYP